MNKYDCLHYDEHVGEYQNGCVYGDTEEEALATFKALTPTAAHHRVVLSGRPRGSPVMISFVDENGDKSAEADIAWHNAHKE